MTMKLDESANGPLPDVGLDASVAKAWQAWADGMRSAGRRPMVDSPTYLRISGRITEQEYQRRIDERMAPLRALAIFRALPWYRRAWLTLTGKAPW